MNILPLPYSPSLLWNRRSGEVNQQPVGSVPLKEKARGKKENRTICATDREHFRALLENHPLPAFIVDPSYRSLPFVRERTFRFTPNAM
jgi:hypothetical protein